MPRNRTPRVPHPVVFICAPKFASSADVEPPMHELRLWADPFDNPRWTVAPRPEDLEDEEDD